VLLERREQAVSLNEDARNLARQTSDVTKTALEDGPAMEIVREHSIQNWARRFGFAIRKS